MIVRTRRRSALLILAVILVILFLIFGSLAWRSMLQPVDEDGGREIAVTVPKNASTAQIASILHQNGIIRNSLAFRVYARTEEIDGKLKPGLYSFNTGMSVSEISRELVSGPVDRVKITIPEGYTVLQIAQLLEARGLVDKEEFNRALKNVNGFPFLKDVPEVPGGLEGYLYPDTYHLSSTTNGNKTVEMMLGRFNEIINQDDYVKKAAAKNLTLHQAVTIASMVEREARVESERPRVAGVIFNRLAIGMPLQIDATVQYALGEPKEKLLYSDLEIDSPYNTYKINGLPPGPIASPGRPSLRAVLEPEENDYLYYVAKPDGSHAFALTLDEHNMNIQKYQ